METKKEKLVFVQQLRAVATLMVLVWHLLVMFWYSNANLSELFHLKPVSGGKENLNFVFTSIMDALMSVGLDFGRFGVAIFFLISGFIIPYSIKESNSLKSKFIFLLKRFLRIWPTYVCGFTIAFCTAACYGKIMNGDFPYNIKDYLIQASLLRDWFWVPSLDGISWTLEVEIKFYLLIFVLLVCKKLYSKYAMVFLAIGMAIFNIVFYAGSDYLIASNVRLYQIMSVTGSSFIYITFMLLGLVLYCYHSRIWDMGTCFVLAQCLIISFLLQIVNSGSAELLKQFAVNYLGAALLFLNFYLLKDKVSHNRFLNYLGDKSYSIFILHGWIGYITLSVLYSKGVPTFICIVITVSAVILLASVFNKFVEAPIQRISTFIIKKIQ